LRALARCSVRTRPSAANELLDVFASAEQELQLSLRRPSEQDRATRTVHAVQPLLAVVVTR